MYMQGCDLQNQNTCTASDSWSKEEVLSARPSKCSCRSIQQPRSEIFSAPSPLLL